MVTSPGTHRTVLVVVVAAAVLLSGCTASGRGKEGPEDMDMGMLHVHGLAVDPRDAQALYAATHAGLFHIRDGMARRQGDGLHDLMGFTVVAPGDFLASGHPDLRDESLQAPGTTPLLGLVSSTDEGLTWRNLSLLGEADFHTLRVANGVVYGADATNGRFMATTDRFDWEVRSRVQLGDFAVDPEDDSVIVATFHDGVRRSRDGGRTWDPLGGPGLVWLSWDERQLFGATSTGRVHVSEDDGTSWRPRGELPGEPGALLAHDDRLFAALQDGSIVGSTDGGATWRTVLAPVEAG